jgi:hypothetical protein
MTIETILNSHMSVAYITDCATSPVLFLVFLTGGCRPRQQRGQTEVQSCHNPLGNFSFDVDLSFLTLLPEAADRGSREVGPRSSPATTP